MHLQVKNQRLYRISVWALSASMFSLILVLLSNSENRFLLYGDFPQYWAAGRLQALNQNPYDPESVIQLRNDVGQTVKFPDAPSMMLYPPWTIPLLIPLGLFPYPVSRLIWLFINIIILLFCSQKIWSMFSGPSDKRWAIYFILIVFPPTIYVLSVGHIGNFFLLSIVLFLSMIKEKFKSNVSDFSAGASLALLTIKPQLLFLLFIVVLLWAIDRRRWSVLIGTALAISTSTFIILTLNPDIFYQYLSTLNNYPLEAWATPTIGMVLRLLFGLDLFWLQFVPSLFGIIWVIYYWIKNKNSWSWLNNIPIIIFVSILTATYGWTFDFTILLLPLLYAAALLSKSDLLKVRNRYLLLFFIISLAVYLLHIKLTDFWFFWFVPVLLLWYLSAVKVAQHRKVAPSRFDAVPICKIDEKAI